MPFSLAGQLAQRAPVVQADAPLGLVAENLRGSTGGVVVVLDRVTPDVSREAERSARVVGIVTQDDLARATQRIFAPVLEPIGLNGHAGNELMETNGSGNGDGSVHLNGSAPLAPKPETPHEILQGLRARDVMRPEVPFIPSQFSLANALLTFDRAGLGSLPVLDETHSYLGMISRADVISALTGYVRPPMVGGLATPLGVWLTDGVLEGGAPTLGLFLSGLGIAGRFVAAQLLLYLIARAINPQWGALALSGRLGLSVDESGLLNSVFFALHALLLLLMFRFTPLAGVHAAEHQTVHALERGLPLTVENVSKMPRAHPRCGTNLMAIASLILVGVVHSPDLSPDWILGLMLITFLVWRSFGDALQTIFTTRPATKKQLESGIKAANDLMRAYQAQPFLVSRSPLRVLNKGMLWAGLGAIIGQTVLFYALDALAGILGWQ